MQRREQYLSGLLELHQIIEPRERRSAFRASVASLARACSDDTSGPLEGLSPKTLGESAKAALEAGLFDDLSFLSEASAGAALYEIAAALPSGAEKRELGRRVLTRLLDGDAGSFTRLATRMALGSGKGLAGEGVRARLAIACSLPASAGVRVDNLAFAIASRRELSREWIGLRAAGSLPDRRLAARLIEHAARAVARKMAAGDDTSIRVLQSDAVVVASERLYDDRESLVWRHIAVARGLLARYHPPFLESIDRGFSPDLSPTEWRRSATSLVASAAIAPEHAQKKLREVLTKGVLRRDPGAAAAFLWGLPAAAEVEPEIAEEMLDAILAHAPASSVADALPEIIALGPGGSFGARARELLIGVLVRPAPEASLINEVDDGAVALKKRLAEELGPPEGRERSLVESIRLAVDAYVTKGARAAFLAAEDALKLAQQGFSALSALEEDGALSEARRAAFLALRDLDMGLFEDGLLHDLLLLGRKGPETQRAVDDVERLTERISEWITDRESAPTPPGARVAHPSLRLRRLRTLLHLVDARPAQEAEEFSAGPASGARTLGVVSLTLTRLVLGPSPVLHRILCATLARAADALLRVDAADPSDVLLIAAISRLSVGDLAALREASMNEDLRLLLGVWESLVHAVEGAEVVAPHDFMLEITLAAEAPPSSMSMPPVSLASAEGRRVAALVAFARAIPADASTRTEATRATMMRIAKAAARIHAARSLGDVAGPSSAVSAIAELEQGVATLVQLLAGARQRLGVQAQNAPLVWSRALSAAIDSVVSGSDSNDRSGVFQAVATTRSELQGLVPGPLAATIGEVLGALPSLPASASLRPDPPQEMPLPGWLPARRTLGGFYIVRPLGSGAGGTVFLARRIEDQKDLTAETFALKVPDYDGSAARTLSEVEFLQLFRSEASALLGLPAHPNLARFVTFDLSSRPKPILVMELVEGLSIDRTILSGALDMPRVFSIIDGVASGLEGMHRAGVAHLDVKPSNVILRAEDEPVLVDFGLAGRHIRPGCATLAYGAPEVWSASHEDGYISPLPADIYGLGCLAFELMTGAELFEGPSEMAVVTSHITHDGDPPKLLALAETPAHAEAVSAITKCLRRDPRDRATIEQARATFRAIAKNYASSAWPLGGDVRAARRA